MHSKSSPIRGPHGPSKRYRLRFSGSRSAARRKGLKCCWFGEDRVSDASVQNRANSAFCEVTLSLVSPTSVGPKLNGKYIEIERDSSLEEPHDRAQDRRLPGRQRRRTFEALQDVSQRARLGEREAGLRYR